MAKHFEIGEFPFHATEKRLPDEIYARALDRVVVSMLDVVVINPSGELFLGKRAWEPAKDLFWIIGGARNRGESFEETAEGHCKHELGIEVGPARFQEVGFYSYAFAKRRQNPEGNGIHTDSTVFAVQLTTEEVMMLKPNEEYSEVMWIRPEEVAQRAGEFHPAIVQICKDYLLSCSRHDSAV